MSRFIGRTAAATAGVGLGVAGYSLLALGWTVFRDAALRRGFWERP